jgi:hypothetical protein
MFSILTLVYFFPMLIQFVYFCSEFADAQMTIRDIKTDLVTSRVPYFDYQSYAFHQLFPNQKMETHPLLHEPMVGP